jgi:dihydrofolate reductase
VGLQCSVFIATTLDGFIARSDGALDWLPGSDGDTGDEDYGFDKFFNSIDTLIIGRKTYEVVRSFDEWPYAGKQVAVLSSGFPKEPVDIADGVIGTSMSPDKLVNWLAELGARHAYVDGGKTIQGFLQAGLIQDITITRILVLIGEGIPLFGSLSSDIKLQHLSTQVFDNGFVQSRYKVVE